MRIMLLTPGTGHFYCGSCLRDDALGRALHASGHEVEVVPLYLPMVLEDPARSLAQPAVHMGGINVYLQQKSRLFRYLPRLVADWLDGPGLLRWASRRGSMTDARDLGAMTVSILRGECGRQQKEVDKLVEWIATQPHPDVVVISNVMLSGVARRLRATLDAPVVATLQGEAPFLDALPPADRDAAWATIRERTGELDALIAVSRTYGDEMQRRLQLPEGLLHVVHNGIDVADFAATPPPASQRRPKTVGYLARMCRDKGLDTLVDAFVELKRRDVVPDLRLAVAGVELGEDRPFVAGLRARLAAAGCADAAEFLPNLGRRDKLAFLQTLSALSVPARYGESFGLYLLEAMAAGVPVVQPRTAAFPEILEATGGGLLCEPDDPTALADGLAELLRDAARADELAARGRDAVLRRFTSRHMADGVAAICDSLAASRAR